MHKKYGGEILLTDKQVCNLSEYNVARHVLPSGTLEVDALLQAVRIATRAGMRQACSVLELPRWQDSNEQDRLIGPAPSGWCDAIDALGFTTQQEAILLEQLRKTAHDERDRYAAELGINTPLLSTTVKPSGSISQLPTTSSGAHRAYAPYYIRRVRVTSSDPIAQVVKAMGYRVYPENGQGPTATQFDSMYRDEQEAALAQANTWVVEFPVKTHATTAQAEETALDQFYRYLRFQKHYTDHNTSVTIQVGDDEWDMLLDAIYEHWDEYIGITLIAKYTSAYPLLPYEQITKEEYEWRLGDVPQHIVERMHDILTEFERGNLAVDDLEADCEGGVCPVR